MTAQILSLFSFARPRILDWSQQELSEFYRVEHALVQAGMRVETDRGISDEGDPWFVFCRQEDGEVIVHFARIGGRYIVSSPSYAGISTGDDFGQLVKDLMSRHPLVHSGRRTSTSNVFLHPTALLIALVATAFFKSGEANAHATDEPGAERDQRHPSFGPGSFPPLGSSHQVTVALEASHVAIVISAAMFAISSQTEATSVGISDLAANLSPQIEADSGLVPLSVANATSRASEDGHRGLELENLNISQSIEMGQNDVLKLLGVVAVLADLSQVVPSERFDWSSFDGPRSAHDEVVFRSIEEPILIRTASAVARSSSDTGHKSDVVVEIVKSEHEVPSVKSIETASGGKIQSFEIVQALPHLLQPFLTESLHITTNQTSKGVFLALDIQVADGPVVDTPDQGGTHPNDVPASAGGKSVLDLAGQPLGDSQKASVVGLIEQFINHTPDYKVLVVDHNIIFYDVHAVNVGDNSIKAVTWDFTDGLSISLVAPSSNFHTELFA